jgi:hypothetical protein
MKELILSELVLKPGGIPQNITPASLITKLLVEIESTDILQAHVEIYTYIRKKYPSVDQPLIHDREIGGSHPIYVNVVYRLDILRMYRNIASKVDSFKYGTFCNGMDAL